MFEIKDLTTAIICILVGVSVLLVGMKLMSNGLKKCIGHGIRRFFKKTQDNPVVSMGIGTVVTAGIQSSDATNAMVIGFINAGAMTVFQGLCIMLGAYIGTTVTGILAAFSSFSISVYFLLFSFVGVVMMFFNNEKVKNIGEILTGLGFLFFGIAVMKAAFGNAEIVKSCQDLFNKIKFGPLLFLIGVVLTALMQSSSAMTSIVIAMVGSGALGLSSGLFIVLGATLGTVTNTLLASIGGSVNGKRAAWIAFFLRTVTSLFMLIFLTIFETEFGQMFHTFAINGSDELPIALFTVFYNLIFMPLLLPFLKPCIKLFTKLIKDKELNELSKCVHFIDDKLLKTPDIAAMQVKKEIVNMYQLASDNYVLSMKLLLNDDKTQNDQIVSIEDKVDYLNGRITDFLIKLSPKMQLSDEKRIGSFFHVINDIERIGDHAYNFFTMKKDMESKDLKFSKEAIEEITIIHKVLLEMFDLTLLTFVNKDVKDLERLHYLEDQTDKYKTDMSTKHFERIKANKCINELTPYYSSLMTELERIADHLTNIGYSIVNPTGDDEEK